MAEDTVDTGTPAVAALDGHALFFSLLSVAVRRHTLLGILGRVLDFLGGYMPTVSGFPGDRRPQQTYVTETIMCVKLLEEYSVQSRSLNNFIFESIQTSES